MSRHRILLSGATGYVGGRLLKALEAGEHELVCLARRPEYLIPRIDPRTHVREGDVLDLESVERAMAGCDIAYYLIHSMGQKSDFAEQDRVAARNFAQAAERAGVERIIYLGGLGLEDAELSEHLRSRHEVGEILRAHTVPVVELRAAIVIGAGSVSFEMIRALTERLPIMITPRWVDIETQPIAIDDAIAYLMQSIELPLPASAIYEIGGCDRITYGGLMQEYAAQRGLSRRMIKVPFLTPYLSSLWLGLVTPLYARIGRKLIDGVRSRTVVQDDRAKQDFRVKPMSVAESIENALAAEDRRFASHWTDAVSSSGSECYGGRRVGNRLIDRRERRIQSSMRRVFRPIAAIGGENGWYGYNWLWRIRGWLDLLLGGIGLRRGRPRGRELRPGDPLDFWRVEAIEAPHLLYLRAEMKVPGRAWLKFELEPCTKGVLLRQTAIFEPAGVLGLLYWYCIYPVHVLVFRRMISGIAQQALLTSTAPPVHENG